jgi:4-hydroxybenzoyl-CoA thioesterase
LLSVYRKPTGEAQTLCANEAVWSRLSIGRKDWPDKTSDMLTNRREIQIEWGDCDPFGIVFFPRYFEYFDACTNALFHRALGYPKAEMLRRFRIAGIPLVQASCNFLVPSSFGDIVTVESCVTQWGKSSFSLSHKLFRDNVLAVEGIEKRVWTVREAVEPFKPKSQPIPKEVIEKFL